MRIRWDGSKLLYFGGERCWIWRSDDVAMLFIVRRSDSKDGAVPPEPVGPMEVAGCEGRADRVHTHVYRMPQ